MDGGTALWGLKVPSVQTALAHRWPEHRVWNAFQTSIHRQSQPVVLITSLAGREDGSAICTGNGIKRHKIDSCQCAETNSMGTCTSGCKFLNLLIRCPPSHTAKVAIVHLYPTSHMLLSTNCISLSRTDIATRDRWQTEIKTEEEENIRVWLLIQLSTTFPFSQRFGPSELKRKQ